MIVTYRDDCYPVFSKEEIGFDKFVTIVTSRGKKIFLYINFIFNFIQGSDKFSLSFASFPRISIFCVFLSRKFFYKFSINA